MLQPDIIRALIAMLHMKEESITRWVDKLNGDTILAIICGFEPKSIPEAGNFYDLMNRFWLNKSLTKVQIRVPKLPFGSEVSLSYLVSETLLKLRSIMNPRLR